MSYESTVSASNLPISHQRSVPYDHVSLDSMLQSSSSGYHQQNHGGNEGLAFAASSHSREDLHVLDESSGSSFHVSNEIQDYFVKNIGFRQCRTSSVGPTHIPSVDQRLPVVHTDGQDSGVEDLGMTSPISPDGLDLGSCTTLPQKEFMVYRRALLCAQFPVLSAPQQAFSPLSHSPYPHTLSPSGGTYPFTGSHFTYLASRNPQARLTLDKVSSLAGDDGTDGRSDTESEEDVLVQNEMLSGVVRKAFLLSEERHQYYDEVITEGLGRKAPARILVEELVSRLSVVENNKHPFYHPQAFKPRVYDNWQQSERRHIGELIEGFWQFALPSPVSSMVKPIFWQSIHQEYQDLMVRLIRLDRREGFGSYSTSMFTSASRRLLKEFGLRFGVGEWYRRIVYLEYLANTSHFEFQVWYIEMILKELKRLSSMLHSSLHPYTIVRQELELFHDVLGKLHEHSKCGLQGLLREQEDCSHKAVALVSLLSSVLNLKTQLTDQKGSTLESYLEGYIKESAKQAYYRHKLRLETELNLNTYILPATPELVSKLVGCAQADVTRCHEYYQSVFSRYKQNIVKLAATTFYSSLMTDVNLVCEMTGVNKDLHRIDQDLLALAQKLSDLDAAWRDYIPRIAQQWRQPMLVQAKAWLKIMTKQLTLIVVKTVDSDKFEPDFIEDTPQPSEPTSPEPHLRQWQSRSSILRHSPASPFRPVGPSTEGSLPGVKTKQETSSQAKPTVETSSSTTVPISRLLPIDLSNITTEETSKCTNQQGAALYFNGRGSIKRIQSMPEMTSQETEDPVILLRRNSTSADLCPSVTPTSDIRIEDAGSGVVSFTAEVHQDEHASDVDLKIETGSFQTEESTIQHLTNSDKEISLETTLPLETGSMQESVLKPEQVDVERSCHQIGTAEGIISSTDLESTAVKAPAAKNDLTCEDDNNNSTVDTKETDSTKQAAHQTPETDSCDESDVAPVRTTWPNELTLDNVSTALGESSVISSITEEPPLPEASGQTTPMQSSNTSSSIRSSSVTSTSTSSNPLPSTTEQLRSRGASVSFQSDHTQYSKSQGKHPDRFSSSMVDVMFISQRIIGFMQKLIGILCPSDVSLPVGPDRDFTASLNYRAFAERMRVMKVELKEVTEEAIIKVLCLYANNLLAMDLCAVEKDRIDSLVDSQVISGVLMSREEAMLSRCRHERESNIPCDYYMNRDTALLCDKHEPITPQMCIRINNMWSIICLLPELSRMLQSRLRGRHLSASQSIEDQQQNGIYDAPMEQLDIDTSSLAEGDHQVYLNRVLQAQINLLVYKLNQVLQQALHVLLSPDFDSLTIADRLQPLTSCLFDHWKALGCWLTPPCLSLFMENLWLRLVADFELEVEGLKLLKEKADRQALLLSQSIAHLIEFLHARGEGLGIDQLVKPAEVVLNMLQLHSLSSKNLVHLYQKKLLREVEADPNTEPLPREVLQAMYQALHKKRKCFTGHHLVMWLLVHYYKAQERPTSKRSKYKRKAKVIGQKLLDMNFIQHVSSRSRGTKDILADDFVDFSSDASVTDSTPFPPVTIHSLPATSIHRCQDINNDSSEDNLESSTSQQKRRRSKRRISDFYSEEIETSDDSSTSRSDYVVRKTVTLKVDVHVSAEANSDGAPSTPNEQEPPSSISQKGQNHQDSEGDISSSDDQGISQTQSSRKAPPPSGGQPKPTSSSSSIGESSSSHFGRAAKVSESKHLFFTDSNHFYYFCDIDDQLFYSVSGDFFRSSESKIPGGSARKTDKHRLHLKSPHINAEFILTVLLCRRRTSRVAKDFTRSIPTEFWKEDRRSPCCMCFN